MARFFVGQRVRVRWARRHGYVGREGRVTEVIGPWPDVVTKEVRLGYGLDIAPIEFDGDGWLSFAEDQHEPILPEGHQPSEFTTLAELLDSIGTPLPA